jgi:hypothetical protein
MTRLLALSAIVLTAAAASCASAATNDASCTGAQLAGSFKAVPGSQGAGNIVYELILKNISAKECQVTGLPQGRLLGKTGKPLPTKVMAAFKGGLTAPLIRLKHGASTHATARFSPDVPGPGENGKQCESVSYWFRVAGQGGGTTKVKLTPPTPVCEHGQLQFSAYGQPRL